MVDVAQASLRVQGGPNSGQEIPLTGNPLTLGRRADNDVMVDETTVSRRHALIMSTPAGFVLRDLNSTNGTFVNSGKLPLGEHPLKHGDRIHLAGSDIIFVFRQEGADTQQMKAVDAPATGAIKLDQSLVQQPREAEAAEPQPAAKEVELQRFLESRKGNVASREEIARFVWPELPPGSEANNAMDEAVELLRAQIEDDPSNPVHLITVGEFGYLLV